MTYFEIVNKLIGNIEPVGSTHIDEKRFENLKEMCHLVNCLVSQIDEVSYKNKDRQEHSMKEMGEYAYKFLTNDLGIPD